MAKASNAELDLMLETVIEMLIKGMSRTDILRHFAEPKNAEQVKSERSVDYYIAKARKEIRRRYKPKADQILNTAVARYEDLYKKNYQIQDYRECRNVQDSLNELVGANAPKRKILTGEGGAPLNPPAQIDYSKLSEDVLQAIVNARKTGE